MRRLQRGVACRGIRGEALPYDGALLRDEKELLVVCAWREREEPIVLALELDGDHALAAAVLRAEEADGHALAEAEPRNRHEVRRAFVEITRGSHDEPGEGCGLESG